MAILMLRFKDHFSDRICFYSAVEHKKEKILVFWKNLVIYLYFLEIIA